MYDVCTTNRNKYIYLTNVNERRALIGCGCGLTDFFQHFLDVHSEFRMRISNSATFLHALFAASLMRSHWCVLRWRRTRAGTQNVDCADRSLFRFSKNVKSRGRCEQWASEPESGCSETPNDTVWHSLSKTEDFMLCILWFTFLLPGTRRTWDMAHGDTLREGREKKCKDSRPHHASAQLCKAYGVAAASTVFLSTIKHRSRISTGIGQYFFSRFDSLDCTVYQRI